MLENNEKPRIVLKEYIRFSYATSRPDDTDRLIQGTVSLNIYIISFYICI